MAVARRIDELGQRRQSKYKILLWGSGTKHGADARDDREANFRSW